MTKWQRIKYQPNLVLGEDGRKVTGSKEHLDLSKEAAKEGMVLLKNEKLLPLAKGTKVVLLGKATIDYVKSGGGSGDVVVDHTTNLYAGMKATGCQEIYEPLVERYESYVAEQYAAGGDPGMIAELALSEEEVKEAAQYSDLAIVSFSRFSGEGWDRKSAYDASQANGDEVVGVGCLEKADELFAKGDFYLSEEESRLMELAKKYFAKVVVLLNVGGVMDTSWIKYDDKVQAALILWNAGEEGGLAVAEVLAGIGYPSGRLADSFAAKLEDYPSTKSFHASEEYVDYVEDIYVGYRYFETVPGAAKVVYPFGYGLSYSTWETQVMVVQMAEGRITIQVNAKNTGALADKTVVQAYVKAPQGKLGKAARSLVAFAKTPELRPGEACTLTLSFDEYAMSSYDDRGHVAQYAYVLEAGDYEIYVGSNVETATKLEKDYVVEADRVLVQLTSHCAPTSLAARMRADGSMEELPILPANDPRSSAIEWEIVASAAGKNPDVRFEEGRDLFRHPYSEDYMQLEEVIIPAKAQEGTLVKSGCCHDKVDEAKLEAFVAGLSLEDLMELLGGQPNIGVGVTFGIGNQVKHGIPNMMTADGPAGLRVQPYMGVTTTAWPCATALACTFNEELVSAVGQAAAREVKENNIGAWLAPAANIHRSPLCGRNFEYYSEDPVLAGRIGAAMVRGVQSENIAATVKHFACNNKETNRINSDSRVSERALREIYLKQFEIMVREANPWCIMSSYNILNGHRTSENKDLLTGILREEWHYDGMVMTDWWCQGNHYKEVKAGNDVKMPLGYPQNLKLAYEAGVLSREEMETSAKRILRMLCKID